MRVQIWGCAWEWKQKDEESLGTKHIDILDCTIGVSSVQTIENVEPLETQRQLQLFVMKKIANEKFPVSPIWITFEGLVEAEQFALLLKEAIEAYKKNEDYDGGTTPLKVVMDPRVFNSKRIES